MFPKIGKPFKDRLCLGVPIADLAKMRFHTASAGSSPSLPDGSNPSAALVQSASDVQCSRLLKTTAGDVMVIQDDSGKPITFEIRKWRQSGDFKPLGTN